MNILALLRLRIGRALVSVGLGAPGGSAPPIPTRALSAVRVDVLLAGPTRVEVTVDAPTRIDVLLDAPARPGGSID